MEEKINILIVDDNIENLRVVSTFLKEQDYQIALATDGKSALSILESNRIDLILLDIMMPEMDGYEVCNIIRKNERISNIPVIFLTARTETEDIVKGFQTGGVDYITKPFKKEELLARVKNHITIKLAKDYLRKCEKDAIETREHFMRALFQLSKIIDRK
ncbi:MAG: response regulator [Bacteroidales bacterium]